jgi:cyclopropane-fatty-acyl-phospholipid synthase
MDLLRAATELFSGPTREFTVRLWDGTTLPPARGSSVRGAVVLTCPRALDAFLPPATERDLSEAYLDGDLELEGDAVALAEAAFRWEGPPVRARTFAALVPLAVKRAVARLAGASEIDARLRGRVHSESRDRQAILHHYDVSDDFYRLFLDDEMVYSCACFAPGVSSLEEAQRAKLELVCRKLALAPGERLLDVGCGWGALVAHAAARHRAIVTGITLSERQLAAALQRVAAPARSLHRGEGGSFPGTAWGAGATILAADYRRLPATERFHKIASVGMMEHVGRARLPDYFGALHRLLHPGGLLLNHAIADTSGGRPAMGWASQRGGGFIERYIFPDADLVPLGAVLEAAERAGFEVRDVESLREHYADTCAAWLARLEARWGDAERLVGRRRARAYRLYLATSSAQFRVGRISVFQTLLAKRDARGRAPAVPRWRGDWYRDPLLPAGAPKEDVPAAAGAWPAAMDGGIEPGATRH